MKKLFSPILVLILLLYLIPSAQSQYNEVYVSLGGGASVPMADYAATDFSDEASGFALVGGNFFINFGYRFNEYFSISGLLNGCVNRYDYAALQDWLTQEYATALPDTRWIVETKSWGLGGILVGPVGSLPIITNKFFLDVRLLGGFLYVYSPAIYVTGKETGEEDKFINIEQSSAPSWALDAGAGFRYNRTRNQYFILNADYMVSNAQYSNVAINTNFGHNRDNSYSQQISTINISLGIGYIIN